MSSSVVRKIILIICVLLITVVGISIVNIENISSEISMASNEIDSLEPMLPMTSSKDYNGDHCEISYKLCNVLPIKKVNVSLVDDYVYLGGKPLGIDVKIGGLIVNDIMRVITDKGVVTPLKDSEVKPGDVLTHINGIQVNNLQEVENALRGAGQEVLLTLNRNGEVYEQKAILAIEALTKAKKIGLYLRDNIQGIGTLTYVNPNNHRYGALGHVISDVTANINAGHVKGGIYTANIMGYVKGMKGKAGELSGSFNSNIGNYGSIDKNCAHGIFGEWKEDYEGMRSVQIGSKYSVHPGKATIMTTINGSEPKEYNIEIIKNSLQNSPKTRGLLIRVVDKELLSKTGGIVQGMSGSPIIQDGKLVGAVTHVFIGDPTKGYGTYIDWMIPN